MSSHDKRVYAEEGHVFYCTYFTLKLRKRVSRFWAESYETMPDRIRFFGAKIPQGRITQRGVVTCGLVVEPPDLDKHLVCIYNYHVKKPAWFDLTEAALEELSPLAPLDDAGFWSTQLEAGATVSDDEAPSGAKVLGQDLLIAASGVGIARAKGGTKPKGFSLLEV